MRATEHDPRPFRLLVGIEDTCVYPADGGPTLDEHVLTEHHLRWRQDLEAAQRLGATGLRYGVSWPVVHAQPGRFEWGRLDAVVEEMERLGLEMIADLVHYGTPSWLADSFADPGYPSAIEDFAGAFAERYRGRVGAVTPLNEPVTTASFCGLRGVWPPRLTGWTGWVQVVVPLAEGMARATRAIRSADPACAIVHVEAATRIVAEESAHQDEADLLRDVGWLPTDLLLGRVDKAHPRRGWLEAHGADSDTLDWLESHPSPPDVMGVNYYPDLTPRMLVNYRGRIAQLAFSDGTAGLSAVLTGFAQRYRLPLAVTETSIEGDESVRLAWLRDSLQAVLDLREAGVDIRGYTWWPLLDFVDWSWAAGGANVEEFLVEVAEPDRGTRIDAAAPLGDPRHGKTAFLRRMGLIELVEQEDGSLDRRPTSAAEVFGQYAARRQPSDAR